jgi:hypothetical protein
MIVTMTTNGKPHPEPQANHPFNRFKELTRKLVAVPKKELDAKEAAYQRKKKRKKRPA